MDSKSWYTSKTIWGAIVAIVGAIGDITMNGLNVANATAIAGALVAIYGRLVATTTIKPIIGA